METLNSKDTRTTFYCIYCKLRAYFIPFSSVFAVDFEQANVSWVTLYQFRNSEIIHCCNYWQMYKNLSEIEFLKKRVWSKVVSPRKIFFLVGYCINRREQFFSGQSFSLFHKSSCGHSFLNGYGIFRRALAAIYCVYAMYLTGI